MAQHNRHRGFTLIELLVVVAIIATLISILLPSLSLARQVAQGGACLSNLAASGTAMHMYHADNAGYFWPAVKRNYPESGQHTYFWGTNTSPVQPGNSPFMRYVDDNPAHLWCPRLEWGSYVPQGGVDEPTTEYGYNGWCLDPPYWGRRDDGGNRMKRKRITDLHRPGELFVFADAAMIWAPAGVMIVQNSTSLDPPTLTWGPNGTPTTHFRHQDRTQALCADGHAQAYDPEGGQMHPEHRLGFVGASNTPHYDQE